MHGAAHITGGGFTDNVPRMLPQDLAARFDPQAWQWPEIFQRIQTAGELSEEEMRKTFNLGIGMVLAVAPEHVAAVLAADPHAKRIGQVVPRTQAAVEWRRS